MCKYGTAEHKNAFQSFAENTLRCKVKWVTNEKEIKLGSKFLLLCNVTSRIPDDLEDVLKDLRIEGKIPVYLKHIRSVSFDKKNVACLLVFVKFASLPRVSKHACRF